MVLRKRFKFDVGLFGSEDERSCALRSVPPEPDWGLVQFVEEQRVHVLQPDDDLRRACGLDRRNTAEGALSDEAAEIGCHDFRRKRSAVMKDDPVAQLDAQGSSFILPGPSCGELWLWTAIPVHSDQRLGGQRIDQKLQRLRASAPTYANAGGENRWA